MDLSRIRDDFPILNQEIHGRPLVYLDNAATSQKPRSVIAALVDYYERYNSNVHRGAHYLAEQATESYEAARAKVARLIGASDPACLIMTRNTTEGLNLVAQTWGRVNVGPGDEIITTELEHHSNIVPWQMLCQEKGAKLRYVEVRSDGLIDLDQYQRLLNPRTKVVALAHMSNVLGTILPVAEMAALAHQVGAVVVVDGAQSVPHMPVRVESLGADFMAFSGHKMLGPTGIGGLWGRRALLEEMPPFMGGGDMIEYVERDYSTYNELPWKFEAGTPNIGDAIAFGAAADDLSAIGMEASREHERELVAYALEALGDQPDVTLYGPRDVAHRGGVVTFNLGDVHPHDLSTVLDFEGVAIRAGHHCCQVLHRKLDVAATARASFYIYNSREEIDVLIRSLDRAREVFGGLTAPPQEPVRQA
jgi:cysteine desulfurase/selenocysteine lyase